MSLPGGSAVVAANMSVQVAQASLEKDFDLLQMVLDMMTSIENAKDQKDELTRKVLAFKTKMAQCQELLNKIPGLDNSPEEQEKLYQKCVVDLQKKEEALEKFKMLNVITAASVKQEEP